MTERDARDWNRAHPVGTPVSFFRPDGRYLDTHTSSEAWASGLFLYVDIQGYSAPVRVDRLTVRTDGEVYAG